MTTTRPLITEADDKGLVVVIGPDAARQLVNHIGKYMPWTAGLDRHLTGAEIHLTGEDVDAFADSTADAHEIHAADPAHDDDRYDAVADARKDDYV